MLYSFFVLARLYSILPFITRSIEHKFFDRTGDGFNSDVTYVSHEYSAEWKPGDEPFYPVNNTKNADILSKYQNLAKQNTNIFFAGRLGSYKYFDMDDTIMQAMEDFKQIG